MNDDPDKLRRFRDQEGLEYPILLDTEGEVIRDWKLLNEHAGGRIIPHPTSLIVDADGIVRLAHTETNYKLRPPSADLVEALRDLQH